MATTFTNYVLDPRFRHSSKTYEVWRNYIHNPKCSVFATIDTVGIHNSRWPNKTKYQIITGLETPYSSVTTAARVICTDPNNSGLGFDLCGNRDLNSGYALSVKPGYILYLSFAYRSVDNTGKIHLTASVYDSNNSVIRFDSSGLTSLSLSSEWSIALLSISLPSNADHFRGYISFDGVLGEGLSFDITAVSLSYYKNYFDGNFSPDPDLTPSWSGSEDSSDSILTAQANSVAGIWNGTFVKSSVGSRFIETADKYYSATILQGIPIGKITNNNDTLRVVSDIRSLMSIDYNQIVFPQLEKASSSSYDKISLKKDELVHIDRLSTCTAVKQSQKMPVGVEQFVPAGEGLLLDKVMAVSPEYTGPYFDGDTAPFIYKRRLVVPKWDGEPNNSTSSITWSDPDGYATKFDQTGDRRFETGVDKVVLYNGEGSNGVPWNGVTSISHTTVDADPSAFYQDGIKYLSLSYPGSFSGKIEAFTYPDEFYPYVGFGELASGFYIGGQNRKQFCLAYRSLVGNDVAGTEYGYMLHLLYGITATASDNEYSSISEDVDPLSFSFSLSSVPVSFPGYLATSHMTIDSTICDPVHLQKIEDILYGIDGSTPRIPFPSEVQQILNS